MGPSGGESSLTILTAQEIRARCAAPSEPLVHPCEEENVRSASYDLRLGDEYYLSPLDPHLAGPIKTERFDELNTALEIPPNQVVLIEMCEVVCIPKDLVGHLSLKLDILLQGLIMASQSQIDAGYKGRIYALLYNLSGREVTLHRFQSALRLEFARLDEETEKPYAGDYSPEDRLASVMRRRITSGLDVIQQEAHGATVSIKRIAWRGAIGGALTLFALLVGVVAPIQKDASDATAHSQVLREVVADLRDQVLDRERQVETLERLVKRTLRRSPRADVRGNAR